MIQMGGENWKKRMGEICRKLVYEKIGEEDLYQRFHQKGELSDQMCFTITKDCSLGPKEAPPAKKSEEKKKTKPSEPKKKTEEKTPPAAAPKQEPKKAGGGEDAGRAVDI